MITLLFARKNACGFLRLILVWPEPYFIQFQFNIGSSLSILSISIRLARQGHQADKVQKSTPLIISKLFLLIVSIRSLEKNLCQKLNYYKLSVQIIMEDTCTSIILGKLISLIFKERFLMLFKLNSSSNQTIVIRQSDLSKKEIQFKGKSFFADFG